VALVAAGEELPDLPRSADLPAEIEQVAIARDDAAGVRARLGRELGLLAKSRRCGGGRYAHGRGGLAIVTAPGEREFSLEAPP